jgi:hypothetical protein
MDANEIMSDDRAEHDRDPEDDCFAPPKESCECYCLHCGRVFMSDQMWFQRVIGARDGFNGFWMCPTPNCGGAGFTFDIFPTDPDHPANAGWCYDDDETGDGEGDEEFDEESETEWSEDNAQTTEAAKEWDPNEAEYARLDDDGDWEGEEWKLGLQPGERPPEPQWRVDARKEWEDEQRKYEEPDRRPREVDWSDREDRPHRTNDDDIPF